jgi:ATP-binding cassette subfamily B protein
VNFLGLYLRVLKMLGTEARLGWVLAFANLLLAAALFAEPMLFGRIVDTLANAQGGSRQISWPDLLPLVIAWVARGCGP